MKRLYLDKKVIKKLVILGILIILVSSTTIVALASNQRHIQGVIGQYHEAKDGYYYTFDHPNGTTIGMESYGTPERVWEGTFDELDSDLSTQSPR